MKAPELGLFEVAPGEPGVARYRYALDDTKREQLKNGAWKLSLDGVVFPVIEVKLV